MRTPKSHCVNRYCMLFFPFLFFMLSSSLQAQTFLMTVGKSGNGTGTVVSDSPGIYCGSYCSQEYTEGEPVTLRVTADPGSVFGGWSGGGCAGSEECRLTMASDVVVTATFNLIGSLSVNEGAVGTQITISDNGFGTKKGKVTVGGKRCRVSQWANESITCEIKAALSPGPHDVDVQPKEPKGAAPITYEEAFTMMVPEIVSIDPGSAPTRKIKVSGMYFGDRKGDVYLVDPESGKRKICRFKEVDVDDDDTGIDWKIEVAQKKCKVKEWTMNPATGESTLTFVMLKKLRAGTTWGLELVNKVGSAVALFTVD